MSLALALNNALSGLKVNQQSIGVLSQNIANVNTPGYSRQIVSQSAVVIEGQGSGVSIDDVIRKIDTYIQRSTIAQSSSTFASQAIDDFYQRVQAVLGKPGASNSIDTYLTGFFNAFQQLAESPETNSLKSNAISAGATLANQLGDLATNIHDLRYEADLQISQAVTEVNNALAKLELLNGALTGAKSLKQPTAGLLDSRDQALRTISQYLNISVSYDDAGAVGIVGGDGTALLEDGVKHRLQYSMAQSRNSVIQNSPFNGVLVQTLNIDNEQVGNPIALIGPGTSDHVSSTIVNGKLYALQQIRDVSFPAILSQLDTLAANLRDQVNTLHNQGTGFPPPTSLTGDRALKPSEAYTWEGQVRIAVLRADGTPVPSGYSDETYTGLRPLTMDLARLNSGNGAGKPSLQSIIDEINNHFGSPGNKAELGNINNIQLVSNTNVIPSGSTSLFDFDFDVENISEESAQVFVTGVTVRDDGGTDITSLTQAAPSVTIQPTNSFTTTNGSADVTVSLTEIPAGLKVGDKIYMAAPTAAVNGISVGNLTGFFEVTAISGSQVTFTAGAAATSSGTVNDAGNIQLYPPYDYVSSGAKERLYDRGQMQVDLTGNIASRYYDITVNVSVVGDDGVVHSAPVTYRISNDERAGLNKRYDTTAVGGSGTLVLPGTSQEYLRAIMVDEKGNELATINGKYVDTTGYLKLVGGTNGTETYSVAIDEMDSKQLGKPDDLPLEVGTNWGFSHFFGLNNFFESNTPILSGDTLRNSAVNLKVQDRLIQNSNLVSTGNIVKQDKGVATDSHEVYTYLLHAGDNSVIQNLSNLNTQVLSFEAAGGLPTSSMSLQGYTSMLIGFVSQRSAEATNNAANAKELYDGFVNKADAISGVNLDEELANTVSLQNAYSANARVVTLVNKMYEDLLQAV